MIYIGHLSIKNSILAYKLVRAEKKHGIQQSVQVLDPIKKTLFSWIIIKGMRGLGISIKEAEFFSGDLRTKDGDSVYISSKNILIKIALQAAESTINGSKILSSLNEEWGRNTILLYLSKYFWNVSRVGGHHIIFKILIADALSIEQRDDKHHLILGLPMGITPDFLADISQNLSLNTYSIKEYSIRKTRLSVLSLIVYVGLKRLLKRTISIFQSKPEFGSTTSPALLLTQEDDLSMDRSYRGQPHWLFKGDTPPVFRTLVMESNSKLYQEPDHHKLKKFQVYSIPKGTEYYYSGRHPVQKSINSALRVLLYESLFGSQVYVDCSFQLAMLFMKASLLADFCIVQNVKAFMTCENYCLDADAMNLIGSDMNVHTFSYQYSNMSEIGPIMMSTADTMFSFSPLFHERWSKNGIQPKSFIDIGYPFDSSFDLVKERARELRYQLTKNNTLFIISYFDESVQDNSNKYGFMSINNHYQEISALAKLVIQDPSTAVIIKTQFQRNSPGVLFKGEKIFESAKATGRFVELIYGKNRNIVFPVEAALASDLVIGHVIGATSGLEAALVGSRCILLNPNVQGANIEIFKQADILYDNLDLALSAIALFREGKPEYQNLGNWEPIIDLFDSYQDGQSANRLRAVLESALLRA